MLPLPLPPPAPAPGNEGRAPPPLVARKAAAQRLASRHLPGGVAAAQPPPPVLSALPFVAAFRRSRLSRHAKSRRAAMLQAPIAALPRRRRRRLQAWGGTIRAVSTARSCSSAPAQATPHADDVRAPLHTPQGDILDQLLRRRSPQTYLMHGVEEVTGRKQVCLAAAPVPSSACRWPAQRSAGQERRSPAFCRTLPPSVPLSHAVQGYQTVSSASPQPPEPPQAIWQPPALAAPPPASAALPLPALPWAPARMVSLGRARPSWVREGRRRRDDSAAARRALTPPAAPARMPHFSAVPPCPRSPHAPPPCSPPYTHRQVCAQHEGQGLAGQVRPLLASACGVRRLPPPPFCRRVASRSVCRVQHLPCARARVSAPSHPRVPCPAPACLPRCSVIRLADAEIQTHHVKNAGEQCTWDESVRERAAHTRGGDGGAACREASVACRRAGACRGHAGVRRRRARVPACPCLDSPDLASARPDLRPAPHTVCLQQRVPRRRDRVQCVSAKGVSGLLVACAAACPPPAFVRPPWVRRFVDPPPSWSPSSVVAPCPAPLASLTHSVVHPPRLVLACSHMPTFPASPAPCPPPPPPPPQVRPQPHPEGRAHGRGQPVAAPGKPGSWAVGREVPGGER